MKYSHFQWNLNFASKPSLCNSITRTPEVESDCDDISTRDWSCVPFKQLYKYKTNL